MLLFDRLSDEQKDLINNIGPKMDVTNVADYFYHHEKEKWLINDFPIPRPPFDRMWVEYKMPRTVFSKENGLTKVHAYENNIIPYFGCFVINDRRSTNDLGDYGLYGGTWYIVDGEPKRKGSEVSLRYDISDSGQVIPYCKANENIEKFSELVYFLYPILMAFSFSNCKNIEVVNVQPPVKLNKSRVSKGKKPLVSYNIINVLPFGKSYARTTRTVSDGQGVALHIRRGNFAKYGEEFGRKKLFNKYSGMFWRPQATVGSIEHGLSVHDYCGKV